MTEVAILYDSSRCTACRGCQVACKQWNDLPAEHTSNQGSYENPADLSPATYTRIKFIEVGTEDTPKLLYVNQGCMHCTEPACADACRFQAIERRPWGAVVINRDKCNGCGYCAEACPFGVPRLDGKPLASTPHCAVGKPVRTVKAFKCDMCQDRVASGEAPACVKTCPANALSFGPRSEMLSKAQERVARRRSKGDLKANVYGETTLGGLHRLYVLTQPAEVYGLPTEPLHRAVAASRAPAAAMARIPLAFGLVGTGLALIIARRNGRMRDTETGVR